ncbi:MAG: DUF1956 domain-containing protein [Acidimicrobiaceae bacterium]|nr:DUF1956 domain-containing protein [Acidimicrobiaceae bacterium]MXW74990.1 DUF1956 domain-containing protein [Acidimicrobiaceae bacterium]MYA73651.1 DUF1956 domain-containing protein [Acidimicrobiaceae bacterium]MYC41182.1 DUF1956 domain-containing protein [Acidimicrobiaceae bacterium]MYD06570.1 DUF1956 domain-containing protein [Acidimicrobiaceae bacterium]
MASRVRRDRADIRRLLLEAAIAEFAENGFEGASTISIANRADAHQPQINYHFASKAELWRAAMDHLFAQLDEDLGQFDRDADPAQNFALFLRRFVEYCAERPQLNQIMVQEATAASERLDWLVDRHIRPRYSGLVALWTQLQELGVAAPIDVRLFHHVLMGAVSLPYTVRLELELLTGADPSDPALIDAHIDGLVATLLPGLGNSMTS